MKKPAVYSMANKRNETFYTGVTSNLFQRIYQHKNQVFKGLTDRYKCKNTCLGSVNKIL
ncbi:MAG: GIY-YIG nuclease family protein [Alphaproteobacteria bacterium]|nr:GIY-YIG nuclease family protein [Alphaproteobacteria bacterium]